MIFVNKHIDGKTVYKSDAEMFPKLYYTDFDGKTRKIKDIDIEISNGDILIQTDINNAQEIHDKTVKILSEKLAAAKKRLDESQKIIDAITGVMEG